MVKKNTKYTIWCGKSFRGPDEWNKDRIKRPDVINKRLREKDEARA